MSSEIAVKVEGLGKCYHVYDKPRDRLMQMLVRGRRKYFREFWALKNVSFEIRKGQTVGIIGRNGSGKSTLLQLICGTLNPTEGSIQVNCRVAALLELGAGFNPEFTGRENIYMAASLYGLTPEQTDARFKKIEEFADIGEFIERPVKTYSSGMYVRLAFAVIAHVDAELLIIDEALAVGDAFFTQKCMRFLRSFMERGTVVFVSHDTNSVVSLCDWALWLDKGLLLASGSAKDLCEQYLEAIYAERYGAQTKITSGKNKSLLIKTDSNENSPRDQRSELINASNKRNDLEIFEFRPDAKSFGIDGAIVDQVVFAAEDGRRFSWVVGGEMVCVTVVATCLTQMNKPIVGFLIRDKLGQSLFGDNTYITTINKPIHVEVGQVIKASFCFRMPILPVGEYSITVAVSDGTQENHIVHKWIHDALIFKSHATSLSTGLIGIPMEKIELKKIV